MLRKVLEKFTDHNVVPPMQVLDQLRRQWAWPTRLVALEDPKC